MSTEKDKDRDNAEKRHERIRAVWRDTSLSVNERQARIKAIMLPPSPKRAKKKEEAASPPQEKTWFDASRQILGCAHYARTCQLVAPCCQRVVSCRLCHDEDKTCSQTMDRFSVRAMRCMLCGLRQPIRHKCRACKVPMADYYCAVCHLFIGKETKRPAFHCDYCGMCRVGERNAWQHCHVCGVCLSRESFDKHICIEGCMKQRCAVCLEDMMSSVHPCTPLRCGHFMHQQCLYSMLDKGQWRCTVCQKAIVGNHILEDLWRRVDDEVAQTPLPEEYRDKRVRIYCRECDAHSDAVPFHFVGLKCPRCGGYNTARA